MKAVLAILVGMLVGAAAYTFWYGQGFSYFSDNPETCINCHVMNEHYDGWLKSSHHAVATCNDCHTPHALVPKYLTKLENGFWHSKGFTFQDFPEPIRIRPHNKHVLNNNCRACHLELVREVIVTHGMDESRLDCIRCHVSVGHGPVR
ncbi:MAG: cytochrome c nitrite reductase small subunit [Verrucomicrobiae bacterium]|nr:cytochrome c nitrite reductase small subunit [Verrucomicrobiae bacterium]